MSWIDGLRTKLALLFRGRAEKRMNAEIDFHIAMEAERLVRSEGLDVAEAKRRALATFGGVENHKEVLRSGLTLNGVSGITLDFKLGARMLRKTPGLTFVGVLSLAVAIAVGAAYLEALGRVVNPTLPNTDTDRILRPLYWDLVSNTAESRLMHDFVRWREELTAVDGVGAFRLVERNLGSSTNRREPQQGAETSALAFRLLHARPLLGRTLLDSDETRGAPAVAVIGEKLWRERFGADSSVVGRTIHWGRSSYTVIGVMADGFAFPINQQLWVPLVPPAASAAGAGSSIVVFAHLAEGKTAADLRAELDVIGARRIREDSATYGNLRPQVKPLFRLANDPLEVALLYSLNMVMFGLLAVCAANVAALVFARTMSRETELAVRTALGANRRRIVWQLAAESLVLCGVALVAGLATARAGLEWIARTLMRAEQSELPFWWGDALSYSTIAYATALAVGAALFIGVVPALRATMRTPGDQLKTSSAARGSAQFGRMWTGVIVGQVAITVLFLQLCGAVAWHVRTGRYRTGEVALPAERYVTAKLRMDGDPDPERAPTEAFKREFAAATRGLTQRVHGDPMFAGAALVSEVPGRLSPFLEIEVEGPMPIRATSRGVFVSGEFFEVTRASIVAGRALQPADVEGGRSVVVVDQTFVRNILGGAHAIGRHVREIKWRHDAEEFGPWLEIVGVVSDLVLDQWKPAQQSVVYRPIPREGIYPVEFIARTRGLAAAAIPQLNAIAASAARDVQLHDVMPMSELGTGLEIAQGIVFRVMMAIGVVILMLAGTGVHALTAFTVGRRRREIGIRTALGADRRGILVATFSRVGVQIATGVMLGVVPGALHLFVGSSELGGGIGWRVGAVLSVVVVAFVFVSGTLAAAGPLRRALSVEPNEMLRVD